MVVDTLPAEDEWDIVVAESGLDPSAVRGAMEYLRIRHDIHGTDIAEADSKWALLREVARGDPPDGLLEIAGILYVKTREVLGFPAFDTSYGGDEPACDWAGPGGTTTLSVFGAHRPGWLQAMGDLTVACVAGATAANKPDQICLQHWTWLRKAARFDLTCTHRPAVHAMPAVPGSSSLAVCLRHPQLSDVLTAPMARAVAILILSGHRSIDGYRAVASVGALHAELCDHFGSTPGVPFFRILQRWCTDLIDGFSVH